MPELPEVETVKRTLENFILNKKIKDIEVIYPRIIEDDVEVFKDRSGRKIFDFYFRRYCFCFSFKNGR